MNNAVLTNALRFVGLLLLQGLIFRRVAFTEGLWQYIHVFIYPLFILLLPLRTPRTLVVFLGFLLGIAVDLFYSQLGLHAAALLFTAFCRNIVLGFLEPRGGYNVNYSPTRARMGTNWFLRYSGVLLALHLFFYFSVEAFTFVFIFDILLNTLVAFLLSFFVIFVYVRVFDPLD